MGGRIVVGADASGPSRAAIDWALARAPSLDMAVELVHVIDERWLGLHAEQDTAVRDTADALLAVELTRAELTRTRMLADGSMVTGRVVTGLPPRALLDASSGADLLVIGTHKTGFIYGRAFGSKFSSLASQAACAVAVIPEFLGRSRRGVVAVAELALGGRYAVEFATAEAVRTGENLVLVAGWHVESLARHRPDSRAVMLEAATAAARAFDARVTLGSRISGGVISEALIAASTTASLLVLARNGTERDDPTLAIIHDVLANISSPVIVL